jgi:uncharacterized membrane protein YfcA
MQTCSVLAFNWETCQPYFFVPIILMLGGVVRGATGFGGAMVMILPLSRILSLSEAIALSLFLELFGPLMLMKSALRTVQAHVSGGRLLKSFTGWAVMGLPVGLTLQRGLDAGLVGSLMSIAIMLIASMMLLGWQVLPKPSRWATRGIGFGCGSLIAMTGIGGPIAAVYFLRGFGDSRLPRSMMHLFVSVMSITTLTGMVVGGLVDSQIFLGMLVGLPIYILASWSGQRLSDQLSPEVLKRASLTLILFGSAVFFVSQ